MIIDINNKRSEVRKNEFSLIPQTGLIKQEVEQAISNVDNSVLSIYTSGLELIYFFDASGSVAGTEEAMAEKFYNQIVKLRNRKDILVSLIIFNGNDQTLYYRQNGQNITRTTYEADGGTALYDTVTKYLKKIRGEQQLLPSQNHKTIVTIMTDGYNNCFYKYDLNDLKAEIKKCKELGWEFIYLAATHESKEEAQKIGILEDNIAEFSLDKELDKTFASIEDAINEYDSTGKVTKEWKKTLSLPDKR